MPASSPGSGIPFFAFSTDSQPSWHTYLLLHCLPAVTFFVTFTCMRTQTVLQLADIHGAYYYIEKLRHTIENIDLILLTGDITHFGNADEADRIVTQLERICRQIAGVTGNCDPGDVDRYLTERGMNLHSKVVEWKGYYLAGLGGSLPCPASTPNEYTENEAASVLQHLSTLRPKNAPFLLVSHQPPYGTLNDRLEHGEHVGSHSIRAFLEQHQPLACLTGHIHEGIGAGYLGTCAVLNPGPFRQGRYALLTFQNEKLDRISLKQLPD